MSNKESVSIGFPHGVLSEDAVYDVYRQQRDLALKYIKLMVSVLE